MKDLQRIGAVSIVLLVVLRVSIGWQLLYEGLWKIDTLKTPRPWSAAGYLKNAQGPLRDHFRNMEGDPDELGWLDYNTVAGRWDGWHRRFVNHYSLDERQQGTLLRLINGVKIYVQPLAKLPDGVKLADARVSSRVIQYDAKGKRLVVSGQLHLKPDEKRKLENLVKDRDDAEAAAFLHAVQTIYERSTKGMGYKEKLAGALKGDPTLLGNADWQRLGGLDQYRQMLARYEQDLANADEAFEWDHLQHTWAKIQAKRAELTGPVKALEDELKEKAQKLLTLEQMHRGPVPPASTPLHQINMLTIAGLTILGVLLIVGLGTRLAAIAAAFMLFNFYMAMPPWPGVPEVPGPEHSFIVNKNLIEVIALLGIAALPTGSWFGVDGLISRGFAAWRQRRRTTSGGTTTVAEPAAASNADKPAPAAESETPATATGTG